MDVNKVIFCQIISFWQLKGLSEVEIALLCGASRTHGWCMSQGQVLVYPRDNAEDSL